MHEPNIKIVLDLKTEFPCNSDYMENVINEELHKELKIISSNLIEKIRMLIDKHNKLKIYQESA